MDPYPLRRLGALVACALGCWPGAVRADGIGVYGRFDHDLSLSAGVGGGAELSPEDGQGRALALVDLRLRVLQTAGLAFAYELVPATGAVHRVSAAVDLRPLFLIFLFQNRFSGQSFSDNTIYDLGIEAGVSYDTDHPAFLLGLGTEMPLYRRRADGLYLRIGARVLFERERWVGGDAGPTVLEGVLALQWRVAASLGVL